METPDLMKRQPRPQWRRRLPLKSAVLAIAGLVAVAIWLGLNTSGCDPCASCSTSHTATAFPTSTATAAPNACLPSSSTGVLVQGTNVTAYVPQGNWESGVTGVNVVPIETSAGVGAAEPDALPPPTLIATTDAVNSCSSNSDTGETVCVTNGTDAYLISGTTLNTTVSDAADGTEGFSGGDCNTCGVVVDSSTKLALLTIGTSTGGPGAFQFLNLGVDPPVFETPIPARAFTSEDVSIDPVRKLVLSPNEQGNYQLLDTAGAESVLYNNAVTDSPFFDSAAEDCTTGIALSTVEGTGDVYIADLKQATFKTGTPNTWTAPAQLQNIPDFEGFAAGTDGIAVAPGTHLGVVTGEFGGNLEGVIQLPSTSGTGTPAITDWAAFTVPAVPGGDEWSQGFDPHTVTAYVSPNNKKAYAVLGNGDNTFLAIVDLQGMLSAPRTGHVVNEPLPAGLVTFVAE